ncbi:MAG: stage V sporulation protein AC [Bacillota bacterium]
MTTTRKQTRTCPKETIATTITKQSYQQMVKQSKPKPRIFRNVITAFVVGGLLCVIGQLISAFFIRYFGFTPETASNPTVATLVLLSSIATGLGVYDELGRFAGAGSAVPVTGFANSVVSAAMEFKREGYILGVGSKMFAVAGPVIVYGAVAAFVVGVVHALLRM